MIQLKKYHLVPGANSPNTSQSLDYGNARSHPVPSLKQAATWHHHISCRSKSARILQPSPHMRDQLSAPSSCQSLHGLWLEKSTFQAGQSNEDTAQAQTDAHAARTASLFKAGFKRHNGVFAPSAFKEKQVA